MFNRRPRPSSKSHGWKKAETRELHLSIEALECRALLSGVSPNTQTQQPVFAVVAPAASGGFQSSDPSGGSSTSIPGGVAPTASNVQQLQQIYFTASLLVSGAQIPLLPYESQYNKATVPPPTTNQQQQYAPPPTMPLLLAFSTPTVGARPLRIGGTGGRFRAGGVPTTPSRSSGITCKRIEPLRSAIARAKAQAAKCRRKS